MKQNIVFISTIIILLNVFWDTLHFPIKDIANINLFLFFILSIQIMNNMLSDGLKILYNKYKFHEDITLFETFNYPLIIICLWMFNTLIIIIMEKLNTISYNNGTELILILIKINELILILSKAISIIILLWYVLQAYINYNYNLLRRNEKDDKE